MGGGPEKLLVERINRVRQLHPPGRIWLRLVARLVDCASGLVPTRLGLTWITDNLAVSGVPRRRTYRRLASAGITAVVDCRAEASDDAVALQQLGIQLLPLPTRDRHGLSQQQLLQGTRWALDQLAAGGRVLVHCQYGIGRAPLFASALLIGQGLNAVESLRTIRSRRWQACLNDRQIEALLAFEARWTTCS